MTDASSTPRRRRSSFRAPAPGSVDRAALHRLFGDATNDDDPGHRADPARNRRGAERAAEHLAERTARAGQHLPTRASAQGGAHAPVPAPALTPDLPQATDFDALITGAEAAAPALPPATEPIAISATREPDRAEPRAWWLERRPVAAEEPDVTREIGVVPERDAQRELDSGRELGARDLLAALDPDGLLEPDRVLGAERESETPPAPARAPVRARGSLHAPDAAPVPNRASTSRPARASAPGSTSDSTPVWVRALADRRIVWAAAATAVLAAGGLGVVVAGSFSAPSPVGTASSESRDAGESGEGSDTATTATITGDLSETAAPITGGTSVSVAGEHLDEVARVSVGGAEAAIVDATADRLTFTVPPAADDSLGEVPVVLSDAQGNPATDATGDGALTLTYTNDAGIEAQLAYVSEHWDAYNPEYPVLPGQDSVNFASQSLVARGWSMDDVWNADGETGTMSAAWSGSTALRDYLRTRTDRATELSDAQREDVKAGDIAQFDWDDSGDRDFTAVVTRVEQTDEGAKVWIAAHSKDVEAWDVDSALASGGTVTYFSIR